jgi:hypothetical protein
LFHLILHEVFVDAKTILLFHWIAEITLSSEIISLIYGLLS